MNTRKLEGIDAKVIEHSVNNYGNELITFEIQAPKFCLTGDTNLHFERWNNKENKQACLATMSMQEFHDKWHNGITKTVNLSNQYVQLDPDKTYTIPTIAKLNNRTPETIYYLRKKYPNFPNSENGILGRKFNDFINTTYEYTHDYKKVLSNMRLRCMDISTKSYSVTNIVDIWKSGIKEVYKVSAGGMSIIGSANHPFYTQRGWVMLGDLDIASDKVYMINHSGRGTPPKNYLSFNRSIKPTLLQEQAYKCKDCHTSINKSCDVHHIKPVIEYPHLAFDKNNVVALCQDCHTQRHADMYSGSLKPTLHPISSITLEGEEEVYDVTVAHKDSNFVANGFVVHNCDAEYEKHRMISSNSSSDRAIPWSKMVEKDYYLPEDVRLNQAGMQGYEKAPELTVRALHRTLAYLRTETIEALSDYSDVHKQHLNRYLLPWSYQKKVTTMNKQWLDYFIGLRKHEHADPAMQALAAKMEEAYTESKPNLLTPSEWHLPYVTEVVSSDHGFLSLNDAIKASVARCARVSYMNHDNTKPSIEKDLELYTLLKDSAHWSTFENQAKPMKYIDVASSDLAPWEQGVTHMDRDMNFHSGNFTGWIQYRQYLQQEQN